MRIRQGIAIVFCLFLSAISMKIIAQTETPSPDSPGDIIATPEVAAPTPESTSESFTVGTVGITYYDGFDNPGRINLPMGTTRYPQWGNAVIADGQLCDEIPQGDLFDTIPLPIYATDFYAEMYVTANDSIDTSIGFAIGDFEQQSYDLLFLMNDFQGVWRIERWYYPMRPGLAQQSSVRSATPLWSVGTRIRIGLEAHNGVYTFYQEQDGVMTAISQDSFTPHGNQLALALWGSASGSRQVCFDSITVRSSR